ncbi:MAG: hypothetical protein IJT14_03925 [Rickettsiales bacterium]|nr:hypothetical protein [Rickettsiales bacterium]
MLKTFGNPTQYQIILDNKKEKEQIVASRKLINFNDYLEYQKEIDDNNRIADIYKISYGSCSDKDIYNIYLRNPDVVFDDMMKDFYVNLTDRQFANTMLNKADRTTRPVEIDLFCKGEDYSAFFFNRTGIRNLMLLSNYINNKSSKGEKAEYYDKLKEYIKKYTLNTDKINKLIENTTKFAFGLELEQEKVVEFTYNFLQHGLLETKKKIEFLKYVNNEPYDNKIFNQQDFWERKLLNDDFKKKLSQATNPRVIELLLKSLNEQKEAMEEFLKNEKECKKYIGNVVNKYYKFHSIIDRFDRTSLEIEKDVISKDKHTIAQLINQHLGKKDPNNQKKLYWNKRGNGCKNGKLLNERCFLNCKSGYIKKINRKYDELLADNQIHYKEKLDDLKSFVKRLNEKEANSRCF